MTEEEYKKKIKKLKQIRENFLQEIEDIKKRYKQKIKNLAEEKRKKMIEEQRVKISKKES